MIAWKIVSASVCSWLMVSKRYSVPASAVSPYCCDENTDQSVPPPSPPSGARGGADRGSNGKRQRQKPAPEACQSRSWQVSDPAASSGGGSCWAAAPPQVAAARPRADAATRSYWPWCRRAGSGRWQRAQALWRSCRGWSGSGRRNGRRRPLLLLRGRRRPGARRSSGRRRRAPRCRPSRLLGKLVALSE